MGITAIWAIPTLPVPRIDSRERYTDMRHAILGAGMWAALILPVGGAQNTKKKADYQATQADYDALVQAQVAAGKVSALANNDRTFTLQLEYQYLVSTGKRGGKVNS